MKSVHDAWRSEERSLETERGCCAGERQEGGQRNSGPERLAQDVQKEESESYQTGSQSR